MLHHGRQLDEKQINFMLTDWDLRFDFNHSTGKLKYTMQIPHLLLNIRVPSMSNPWNWVTDLHLWMLHDGWRTSAPPPLLRIAPPQIQGWLLRGGIPKRTSFPRPWPTSRLHPSHRSCRLFLVLMIWPTFSCSRTRSLLHVPSDLPA